MGFLNIINETINNRFIDYYDRTFPTLIKRVKITTGLRRKKNQYKTCPDCKGKLDTELYCTSCGVQWEQITEPGDKIIQIKYNNR